MERYAQSLRQYIIDNSVRMIREPEGHLKYPYIVPCSPDSPLYTDTLWDWDSWLTGIVLGQVEIDSGEANRFSAYEQGAVLNFLDHMDADGYMPICMTPISRDLGEGLLTGDKSKFDRNMHKPVLIQHAASIVQRLGGELKWLMPHLDALEAFLNRYCESHREKITGLAYWQDDLAVGVDNDPSVFYRPDKSCGSIYLNCLLYREMLAFGYLLEMAGEIKRSIGWRRAAQDLADAVNEYCWDERDGTYYSVDFALRPVDPDAWLHSGAPRAYPCLLLRVDSWSSFMPLWAGLAPADRAARMVKRYRDTNTFNCRGGIRTLSRLEKAYDLRASNNPSNWLGPVWGVSNYLVFDGLMKYGYEEDAAALAEKTVRLFGRDLEVNGSLHEYYHPDSCEPIITHGFQNWNFLALNMMARVEGRKAISTF